MARSLCPEVGDQWVPTLVWVKELRPLADEPPRAGVILKVFSWL